MQDVQQTGLQSTQTRRNYSSNTLVSKVHKHTRKKRDRSREKAREGHRSNLHYTTLIMLTIVQSRPACG